jgi:two-component system, chemotaxis family, CheB/CheR fusion protein
MPGEAPQNFIVVVGASSGGIEALSVLLESMPSQFSAPIVTAQHLDPNRSSHLAAVLSRRSKLPVVQLSNTTVLQSGTVYVVPPNAHARVVDGSVEIEADGAARPMPSIDLLFTSAAEAYGDRAIAVILSGSGRDGSAGAVEVKRRGGWVIIQTPDTARYPSMPLSLPPSAVDYTVSLEEMPVLLEGLASGVIASEGDGGDREPVLRAILEQTASVANIDFTTYKETTILRRIARRMAATRCHDLGEYLDYLRRNEDEVRELVSAFLIKVTEFFRDTEAFDFLRTEIVPVLIERARDRGRVLRIWSVGCATGEEPFSLAMMVSDLLGPELSKWTVKIFATDLDTKAIEFARRGVYATKVVEGLPPDYLDRFFERGDGTVRVAKDIRQMVIFGQQDLSRGVPFPRIDLLVCRNLLIYFKPELQEAVLDLFAYSLQTVNGFLFLGMAETARPSQAKFEPVNKKWKVYVCTAGPLVAPPRSGAYAQLFGKPSAEIDPRVIRRPGDPSRPESAIDASPLFDLAHLRRFNEMVFRTLPVGVVVIDKNYRILTINSAARRLLHVVDALSDGDFLHAVRGIPYGQLRDAIDSAFRERSQVVLSEIAVGIVTSNEPRFITLVLVPVQVEAGAPEQLMICASDVTDQVLTRREMEGAQARHTQLLEELSSANRKLSDLNAELQDANQQLVSSNEEMALTQEELQATNEELEATNEELQATNEELETNNEELQATNEELEATNDELAARTQELQELTKELTNERVRLVEMVENAPFYIMVLRGQALVVAAYNTRFEPIFEGRNARDRPLEEIFPEPEMTEFINAVREALRLDTTRTLSTGLRLIAENDGKAEGYLRCSIVPNHDATGKVDGAVVYAEDLSRDRAIELEDRREKLKLMVEHAHQVALGLYDAASGKLLQASPRYLDLVERAHAVPRQEIVNRTWAELPLCGANERPIELFRMVRDHSRSKRLSEVRLKLDADRQEIVLDFTISPIAYRDGPSGAGVRFMLVSAFEITDQVRAREELLRTHQMKDEFLALASHELRTPLVPLSGYTEMLAELLDPSAPREDGSEQKIRSLVMKSRKQIDYLTRLIGDIVDVARLQSGKLTMQVRAVRIADIVEAAIEQARMLKPKQRIETTNIDRETMVWGDEARLVQVVVNLLENAIKYAPDAERIEISTAREGDPPEVKVAVRDFGPGIGAQDAEALFTKFFQGKKDARNARGGLGLGLFIAKSIVDQHGGTIALRSKPGEGSTFELRFPALKNEELGA